MPEISPTHPLQSQIQALLDDYVNSGEEVGLQAAVYHEGRLIVDAWSGLANPETGETVNGGSIFAVWSTSKGVASTAVHHLVATGKLTYDTRLVEFWPEFGRHGKEKATVRHVLIHGAGVPQMPHLESLEHFLDWDAMCEAVADLRPLWEPGTAVGYHAVTMGWLVGETVRRVSGQTIDKYLQQHIFGPLNIDGCFMGVPEHQMHRIAPLQFEEAPAPAPADSTQTSAAARAAAVTAAAATAAAETHTRQNSEEKPDSSEGEIPISRLAVPENFDFRHMNDPRAQKACLPASGGIMSARGLARLYAMYAGHGTLDGVTIFSPEHVDEIRALQTDEVDRGFLRPHRKGLGYMLGGNSEQGGDLTKGDKGGEFGHGGMGGSNSCADPERKVSIGLTKNLIKFYPTRPTIALAMAELVRNHFDNKG